MLTMLPNSVRNIVVITHDGQGQVDTHDIAFTSNDPAKCAAQKTGPNTATLTTGPDQGEATLTIQATDEPSFPAHFELVKIDDRTISSVSVEFQ